MGGIGRGQDNKIESTSTSVANEQELERVERQCPHVRVNAEAEDIRKASMYHTGPIIHPP